MDPQKYSSHIGIFHVAAIGVALLVLGGLFGLVEPVSSQEPAQEPAKQEIEMVPPGQEKKFAVGVPPHLPLKIKVKNVNSKKWVHDIEVEVTNTSDKPIYYLDFYIDLPGIKGLIGSTVGFWLHYGRPQLIDFTMPVLPEDVPLEPGEKYTFKIPESSANGWDHLREKEGRPEPKAMKLIFQRINFGDGTGYSDTSGSPVNIHKKMSSNRTCVPPPKLSLHSYTQQAFSFLPASFLPVKFSTIESSELSPRTTGPKPDNCCAQSSCNYVRETTYVCSRNCSNNPNPFRPSWEFIGCSDSASSCRIIDSRDDTCTGESGPLTCVDTVLYPCIEGGGPEEGEAACRDGIDNDGDGVIDCNEPGCSLYCPSPNSGGGTCERDLDCQLLGCYECNCVFGLCSLDTPVVIDVTGNGFARERRRRD